MFQHAQTFGGRAGKDEALGRPGWNRTGTGCCSTRARTNHPDELRSGRADPQPAAEAHPAGVRTASALALAARVYQREWRASSRESSRRCCGRSAWTTPDPTTQYRTDVSWPSDPDDVGEARRELADIIEQK